MHWKGGILGGLTVGLGWVVSHIDPISALLPTQYASTIGTVIGFAGTLITMFSHKVTAPKQIGDVIPQATK